MKKLTILGVVFLSMTILFSCGEDAKSDKESEKDKKKDKYKKEIKDPCDILDYSVKIFEDLNDLADNYDDIDELEDDKKDKKKVDDYFDDLEEAWKYAFKEFDNEEILTEVFGSCDNEEIEEESYEVEYFFEERFEDFTDFIDMKMNDLETEDYEGEDAAADYGHAEEATEEEYYYEEEYETEEVPSKEVLSNGNETENLNSDNTPFYIINTSATKNENQAKIKVENLISNGYKAGYLWIPDYKSLSGAEYYSVYIGPFYSQYECEKFVDFYRGINPESYGLLVSHENKRVKITGIGKVKVTDPYHNQ